MSKYKVQTPWQKKLPDESNLLQQLLQKDSLTAALQQIKADFSVQLLGLGVSNVLNDEKPLFRGDEEAFFARTVTLSLNQTPVVFARSVCHQKSHLWLEILDRGNSSLGEKLFDGSLPLSRSEFEYSVMLPETYFASVFERKDQNIEKLCVARRSTFLLDNEPLLLTEIFLPDLMWLL